MSNRKAYPSDVSDEEWTFVAPYLTLVHEDAPQRTQDFREVTGALIRTLRSSPESGHRAGYDGAKHKKGSEALVLCRPGEPTVVWH